MRETASLTLRQAIPSDQPALIRLSQLDCRPLPPAPHLVAERDGRIDAALSLSSGETVADPFRRTAELRELLRDHAATIAEPQGRGRDRARRTGPILETA
jgi:hypothetical protein